MEQISNSRRKALANAAKNRREIVEAKLSRREMIKMGLLTGAGMLVAKSGLSQAATEPLEPPTLTTMISPPTTPFTERLGIPRVATPVTYGSGTPWPTNMGPEPQGASQRVLGEAMRNNHQAWARYANSSQRYFHRLDIKPGQHSFHSQLPNNTIWGYNGTYPGTTVHAHYGEPCVVRQRNFLPSNHVGFGMPQVSTHLHNGHTPSESDGFPSDFYPRADTNDIGYWKDHCYPNARAGFTNPLYAATDGDVRETMSTLWFHDHRFDFTSQNVYKGLTGFYLLFGEHDSGDENDTNPNAFRLPSGEFDVPLLFGDKVFDQDGQLFFDLFNLDGILGDKFVVNGKIQPFFEVARRKYRFRLLNTGPSRFYQIFLSKGGEGRTSETYRVISNDGNLLPQPINVISLPFGVAERKDIIIDFSKYAIGDELYLENRLEQIDGRKPEKRLLSRGTGLLKFKVTRNAPDPSRVPSRFFDLPPIDMSEVKQTRTFDFDRQGGMWTINGHFFQENAVRASPKKNTAEIWVLKNLHGGWAHPIHIHFEEFQILSRNGRAPNALDRARKDVVVLGPNEEVRIFMRFRDFAGRHPMHCHNVVHEDHAMMMRWDIVE